MVVGQAGDILGRGGDGILGFLGNEAGRGRAGSACAICSDRGDCPLAGIMVRESQVSNELAFSTSLMAPNTGV